MSNGAATADAIALKAAFATDVREWLQRTPRQLPSKYFYDELGSALFEAICRLPWYRITRAEESLLARHAADIVRPLQHPVSVAELGGGSGEKLAIFAGAAGVPLSPIQLIDISDAALDMARYRLTAAGFGDAVRTHHAMYEEGLARAVAERPGKQAERQGKRSERPADGAMLVLFLGSNIGNFDPPVAHRLLSAIRGMLREGDALLLGTDLVKPERELLLAYDDPLLVTAAFNRNLLRRINDELGGNFDLHGFAHRASWNGAERRVEAHLISKRRQHVTIPASGMTVTLEEGEAIWTESSHKYEPAQVRDIGWTAGFGDAEQWIDAEAGFALTRLRVTA